MTIESAKRKFPAYFDQFELPDGIEYEKDIVAYRACPTGKVDRESFLSTYEDQGFCLQDGQPNDPSVYSVSLDSRLKQLKRFANMTSRFQKPYCFAEGTIATECGPYQFTRDRKYLHDRKKYKNYTHIDWWLYEGATPWVHFHKVELPD